MRFARKIAALGPKRGPYIKRDGALVAAYGVKRVLEAYTGPLFRLVRASDSAVLDVWCLGKSDLPNYGQIDSWIGTSTAKFDILYDQTGNANHITQTTDARRPIYRSSMAQNGVIPCTHNSGSIGSNPVEWNIPNTISLDRAAFSVAFVMDARRSLDQQGLIQFHTGAGSTQTSLFTEPGHNGIYESVSGNESGIRPRAQLAAYGFKSAAGAMKFWARETTATGAANSSTTMSGGGKFGGYFAGSSNFMGDTFSLAIWNVAVADTVMEDALAAFRTSFYVPTVFDKRIIFDGDSITMGQGNGSVFESYNGYVKQTRAMLNGKPEIFNLGIGGQSMATINTNKASRGMGLYTASIPTAYHLLAGINDLLAGTSGSTIHTAFAAYVDAAQALGAKVAGGTTWPANAETGPQETERLALNTLIVANSSGAEAIANYQADSHFDAKTDAADATLYYDGTHPTILLSGFAAPICSAAINSIV